MKKNKGKYSMYLSLFVAMLFLLSSLGAMATTTSKEKAEASEVQTNSDPQPQVFPDDCVLGVAGLQGIEPGLIQTGCKDLIVKIQDLTPDGLPPCECPLPFVKAFVEVYKQCCGKEVIMYETSFEDNFDIYNNWIQIDGDCNEVGGHYDSFTHSDARSSDGDYSMKCSMYDIYKGNQDDYLECIFEDGFDVSEQERVNVTFDIYVDGDGEQCFGWPYPYSVFDYLSFEVNDGILGWESPSIQADYYPSVFGDAMKFYDCNPGAGYLWSNPWGAYHFFLTTFNVPGGVPIYNPTAEASYLPKAKDIGNGWWNIWWDVDVAYLDYLGIDTTNLHFRFAWHSDPEFQYEGAYVDNFKVISIEECENKVFQSHTQGAVNLADEDNVYYDGNFWYVKLPMQWCAEYIEECGRKETNYELKVWIEVLDDCWGTHDSFPPEGDGPVCINVQVADWADCTVGHGPGPGITIETSFEKDPVVVPPQDSGVMTAGDDAHIMTEIHIAGSVPAENIPVVCYAQKIEPVTVWSWDVESTDMSVELTGDWHRTQDDAWTGSYSLGYFDEDTKHYKNDVSYETCLMGPTIDVSKYEELYYDFYAKYITQDVNDCWGIVMKDDSTNFQLSHRPDLLTPDTEHWRDMEQFYPTYGYHPAWRGLMQPMGEYRSFDIIQLYNSWLDMKGQFTNTDGSISTELKIGMLWYQTDSSGYTNPIAEDHGDYWSGGFFDDFEIRGREVQDEHVFEQTIIIPGPLEPCDQAPVQFEWEDVPYSNYKITIECTYGCYNCPNKTKDCQILVVSDKERADEKEVESIDLTDFGAGEFGISTSDTDNYLASNADNVFYDVNLYMSAYICPEHGDCDNFEGCCLDVSHLTSGVDALDLSFDAWFDIECDWDYAYFQISNECEPGTLFTDWTTIAIQPGLPNGGGLLDYVMTGYTELLPAWDFYFGGYSIPTPDDDGWCQYGPIDLWPYITGDQFAMRLVFWSDAYTTARGLKLDSLEITNLLYDDDAFPPETTDFLDEFDDMSNICSKTMKSGQFWEYVGDDEWCTDFPIYDYEHPDVIPMPILDALIWETEIMDCYEAYLTIETYYDFGPAADGKVQISDDGGTNWYTLDVFTGTNPDYPLYTTYNYDLTFWAGSPILIRFIARNGHGGFPPAHADEGEWCVKNMMITGKQDHTAPTSSATMSGTMKESGWYSTSVKVKITAEDDASGIKEIHYILDGVETVIAGDTVEFTVAGNGQHTIEYWCVDFVGNIEAHHIIPAFKIDAGAAPTVAITSPEPGIYLFGNKILSSSNVFIIGAFTIEANAEDTDSGIYRVSFYLDDQLLGEDTEAPFSQYVATKHMGAGTIKVVAEDFAQNVADDTLDIKYYKFF